MVSMPGVADLARKTSYSPTPTRTLAPGGVVLRGSNIAPKAAHIATGHSFRALFAEWDWTGWIKRQVDLVKSLGGNCVRLIGDVEGVNDGTFTQAYYLACWQQLIEYAASIGVYVYPSGGGQTQFGALSVAQITTPLVALAGLAAGYPNVIGMDVIQEAPAWGATNGATVTASLRAVAPSLKLTFSTTVSDEPSLSATAWRDGLRSFVDFWDAHLYYNPSPWVLYNAFWNNGETKPVMVGEFGLAVSSGQPAQTAHYQAIAAVGRNRFADLAPAGMLSWAALDFSNTASDKWGLFDLTDAPRTYLTDVFATLPVAA